MRSARIGNAVGHVTGRHVPNCGIAVPELVVEEDVGLERPQELPFRHATEEQGLIDSDIPRAQRADDPLMGWRGPRW
jgi:hypothetical protein